MSPVSLAHRASPIFGTLDNNSEAHLRIPGRPPNLLSSLPASAIFYSPGCGARATHQRQRTCESRKAAALASAITLWIQKSTGVQIQEKLEEPYGDYTLIQFSEEKLNQKIPDSKFDQKFPPGVEKQVIQ